MDPTQRPTQIVEGAGREEARMNLEFIQWLQKWGPHMLFAAAGVSLAYYGWSYWQRAQARALNEAHAQLIAAQDSGSPDNLLRIAREHGGRGAVLEKATLHAADLYLQSGLTRIAPGGRQGVETDKLNDEQRTTNFEEARRLYGEVERHAANDPSRVLFLHAAKFGLASVAASTGDIAGAMRIYDEIEALAKSNNLPGHAEQAKRQKELLARDANAAPLPSAAQIAAAARPKPPETPTPSPGAGSAGPELPPITPLVAPPAESAPPGAGSETGAPKAPEPAPTPPQG